MAVYKLSQKQCREAGLKWAVIPVATLENKAKLTPQAHSLLLWMLAKPHNWKFNVTHIIRAFEVSRKTVSRWFKELEKHQYLQHEMISQGPITKGKYEWIYTVFPLPKHEMMAVIAQDKKRPQAKVLPFSNEATS